MFQRLRSEATGIINECISISYFMRGAVQYDELLLRTPGERQLMADFLNDRIEKESKKEHPVY